MSKEPVRNKYVGHRYVPKIMGEWEKKETYEGLSIVTNKGASYTSKKRVPVGIDISDEEYWVITGNYDAQVDYYRDDVKRYREDVNQYREDVESKADLGEVNQKFSEVDQTLVQVKNDATISNDLINDIAIYNGRELGLVSDGVTDDTKVLEYIMNNYPNTLVKLPENSTTIITKRIRSEADNFHLLGLGNATIKLGDNSGILDSIYEQSTSDDKAPLLRFFGVGSGVDNVTIDGNLANNYITHNGQQYHAFLEPKLVPNQVSTGGHGGIGILNDHTYVKNCVIKDVPWSGIELRGPDRHLNQFTVDKICSNNTLQNTGRDAITVFSSKNSIITDNKVINPQWHGIHDYINNKDTLIENNLITLVRNERIEMYPNHRDFADYYDAITIDHGNTAYRDSLVEGTKVINNKIDGLFDYGITATGYAKDYEISNNLMIDNLTSGIRTGYLLGIGIINNNRVINSKEGLRIAQNYFVDKPTYPSHSNNLSFMLTVQNNMFMDIADANHIVLDIRLYENSVLTDYLRRGHIKFKNNTVNGRDINTIYRREALEIPQLVIYDDHGGQLVDYDNTNNGYYIRESDGTVKMFHLDENITLNVGENKIRWDFPIKFYGQNYYADINIGTTGDSDTHKISSVKHLKGGADHAEVMVIVDEALNNPVTLRGFGFGRWKDYM